MESEYIEENKPEKLLRRAHAAERRVQELLLEVNSLKQLLSSFLP